MRKGVALGLITLIASLAVASCGEGGTGTGTAPPPTPPCPATPPAEGSPCPALNSCAYSTDAGLGTDIVAVCPFAGGTWEVHTRGDGGTFTDAEVPEVLTDAPADAAETTDASDDAADAADAADALEDTTPVDASADTAADAG